MWTKIVILLLVSIMAQARPSYLHTSVLPAYEHYEYAPTVVGHTYHSIPTAVSHQSQTIVHEKRPYLRPIIEHTPIVKAYVPETAYTLPLSHHSYAPISYSSGIYNHGGWSPSLSSAYGGWNGWPLK